MSSSSVVFTRLIGFCSRSAATQRIWKPRESNPRPLDLLPETVTTRPQRRSYCIYWISNSITMLFRYTESKTSLRSRHIQIVTYFVTSLLERYLTLFSTYDGSQCYHTGDLTEYTRLFLCKVAYSWYDVPLWRPHRNCVKTSIKTWDNRRSLASFVIQTRVRTPK
jgi:hypothetical protein